MAPLFFAGTKVEQRFRSCKYFSIIFCIPHSGESWNGITRYIRGATMTIYRKTYSSLLPLRFSTRNIRKDDDLLNLPLYRMIFWSATSDFYSFFSCSNNVLRLCNHNNVHITCMWKHFCIF